ncbi:MAG: tetratricopeptide repeat protein [Elusimicrobiota bacterium]|nr:MAG: tetratricopeptide repeat protein [Elusimicrobiota bacterium]
MPPPTRTIPRSARAKPPSWPISAGAARRSRSTKSSWPPSRRTRRGGARARILQDLGRPAEAKSEWRDLSRGRDDAESLLNLGWTYWRERNVPAAREVASLLLKLDDRNPTFLRFMANMEIEAMNYAEALKLADRALAQQPGDRDASLTRSKALFRLQREGEARAVLRDLIKRFPAHAAVQYHWAETLAREGSHEEAISWFDKLIASDPSNPRYKFGRAATLYDQGRFDDAVAAWKELALSGGDAAAFKRLRDDAFHRRAWLEAAEWQEKVIDLDPGDPVAWERLAQIYSAMRRNDAALLAAEKAISVDPESINAYYLKAEALDGLNDWDGALAAYEEIVRRKPNSIRGYDGLAYVHEARKDFKAAIAAIHKIAELTAPTVSPYLLVREARLQADLGRYAKARRLLARVSSERSQPIPVLLYHGISRFERADGVPQHRFREQMIALKEKGYQSITVGDLDRVFQGKATLPAKPILITFDDGRSDSFVNADPVLKEVGYKATMFVHLSKLRKPHFHASNADIAAWESTGRWEMQAHGTQAHDPMRLDAHGHKGHFLPNRKWLEDKGRVETVAEFTTRVDADYKEAREGVEQIIGGRRVVAFAYPYGDYGQNDYSNNPDSTKINQSLVRKHFRLAFVQEQYGINTLSSNPTDLRRFEVQRHMTARQLTAHLALAEPYVHAKLGEAQMWVEAGQIGRAEAVYSELEKLGVDEPRLWADKGAAFSKSGDIFRAQSLFARAGDSESDKDTRTGKRYARLQDHAERAAAPRIAAEGQLFTDSDTNRIYKVLGRASASVRQVRLSVFGGPGWYDDDRRPAAPYPRIDSREAGADVRWFAGETAEVNGFYTRRMFLGPVQQSVNVWNVAGGWQALPALRLGLRGGEGNVETAAGIRAARRFDTQGAGAGWDPALNWKVAFDYDRSRFDDGNITHGGRARVTKRFSDLLSVGAAYFRGESTRRSPEYFTPRRLNQYSGIAALTRSFGEPGAKSGLRPLETILQYEGGYGWQEGGSRPVHSVRAGVSVRPVERLTLSIGGQYSDSPQYIMRRVDAGVSLSL